MHERRLGTLDWLLRLDDIPGFRALPRDEQYVFLRLYFTELTRTLAAHETATCSSDREAALETGRTAALALKADVLGAIRRNEQTAGGIRAPRNGGRLERLHYFRDV